jgi:hypothetical protein
VEVDASLASRAKQNHKCTTFTTQAEVHSYPPGYCSAQNDLSLEPCNDKPLKSSEATPVTDDNKILEGDRDGLVEIESAVIEVTAVRTAPTIHDLDEIVRYEELLIRQTDLECCQIQTTEPDSSTSVIKKSAWSKFGERLRSLFCRSKKGHGASESAESFHIEVTPRLIGSSI